MDNHSSPALRAASFCLESLPDDVLFNILSRLTPEQVASTIAPLSRLLRTQVENPMLWKHFCGQSSGLTEADAAAQGGWKALFRKVYRTNLLFSPHFELLDELQKREIDDSGAFDPVLLTDLHPFVRTSDAAPEPDGYWSPWHFVSGPHTVSLEQPPVGCPPCPGAPIGTPNLVTSSTPRQVATIEQVSKAFSVSQNRVFGHELRSGGHVIIVSDWHLHTNSRQVISTGLLCAGQPFSTQQAGLGLQILPSKQPFFVSFRATGLTAFLSQRVGLANFPLKFRQSLPGLVVSFWCGGRSDCTSLWTVRIDFISNTKVVVYRNDDWPFNDVCPSGAWAKVQWRLWDYDEPLEEIKITLYGGDAFGQSEWYGAKFTGVQLRFVPPGEVIDRLGPFVKATGTER